MAGHDNSLDLVNNFGKTFHMYGWYLGLIRTKVDAKYLRNVANCRVFISIEEYITPISESEQILQTVSSLLFFCNLKIKHFKKHLIILFIQIQPFVRVTP